MLVHVPNVLHPDQVRQCRSVLASAEWEDGRATAGAQSAQVKRNLQLPPASLPARELGSVVLGALEKNPLFISSVLPQRVYPPLFNRYDATMGFGSHVDNAIRGIAGSPTPLRTDVSATSFSRARELRGWRAGHRGHLRPARGQARPGPHRLPRQQPPPRAAGHPGRATRLVLLGPEPGPGLGPAGDPLRPGHGAGPAQPGHGAAPGAGDVDQRLPQPSSRLGHAVSTRSPSRPLRGAGHRARRELALFGTVRRGDDRRFWRRMLRLLRWRSACICWRWPSSSPSGPCRGPCPRSRRRWCSSGRCRAPPRRLRAPATHPRPPKARPRPQPRTLRPRRCSPPRRRPRNPARDARAPEPAGATARVASRSCRRSERWTRSTGEAPVGLGEITRRRPSSSVRGHSTRPAHARWASSDGWWCGWWWTSAGVSSPARPGCSPVAALDAAAALAAIVQWRFSNSVDRLGRPVRVVLDIPVEFSLR